MSPPREIWAQDLWGHQVIKFWSQAHGENWLFQLNELEDIYMDACENACIHKKNNEEMAWQIHHQERVLGNELVLLFNSGLKLFPSILRSRCSDPFKVLKHYSARESIEGKVTYTILNTLTA